MIIITLIIISLILYFLFLTRKEQFPKKHSKENYKGIVLFDIDGTLSTGTDNYKVVQYFIDKNYAVGISTAGSIYTPNNLQSFSWMPTNLYNWMNKHNFDTFNNVVSGILCGKYNPGAFNNNINLDIYTILGWKKGLTLEKSAEKYGILDPTKMFMFDNDSSYLNGLSMYNPQFNLVCAGKPCDTNNMSMNTISKFNSG